MQLVGRYAPSPTGALHLGNLRTALIAWLHARLQSGEFLLRMEDLDQPRVVAGSAEQIVKDLRWLGLDWDGPIIYQSERHDFYQQALKTLDDQGLIYPCFCSRKELREAASAPHGKTPVYPGTCRPLTPAECVQRQKEKPAALRLCIADANIEFIDGVLGEQAQDIQRDVGDFVVKRADQLFAYQFAVVVDDLAQGVTHVVRGADLADSTARQLYLAQLIQPTSQAIRYWHVPLKHDAAGQRMAKRDGADSAESWRHHSSNQALVGSFAFELGLIDRASPMSASELLSNLTIDDLQRALTQQ